jgi:hypothetical protein
VEFPFLLFLGQESTKVAVIKDIWSEGLGVISLHVFQNVIPCEAYTREACMIDALGKKPLKPVLCH